MKTLMMLASFCYFLGMVKYFLYIAIKKRALFILATAMIGLGFIFHTAMLIMLSAKTGHGPYTNPFEYTSFFAWTTMGALLLVVIFYRVTTIGVFVSPVGFLLMAHSFLLPFPEQSQAPAKEFWLTMHFTLSFLALSSFMVMFAASLMYLMQEKRLKKHALGGVFKRMPDLDTLDSIYYGALVFGFPLITVGMASGVIGSWTLYENLLGPNPLRTLPMLIVWVVYATVMVGRTFFGWRGHQIALLGTAGFAAAILAVGIHLH
jgi:ABC-type uncharacterized transport system permease subunit